MTKKITKTITTNLYTVKALSISQKKLVEKVIENNMKIAVGDLVKVLQKFYNTDDEKIVKVDGVEHINALYEMSEAEFIAHAHPVNMRTPGNYISRTVTFRTVTVAGVENEEYKEVVLSATNSDSEADILTAATTDSFTAVAIIAEEKHDTLYQMSDKVFVQYGHKVEKAGE